MIGSQSPSTSEPQSPDLVLRIGVAVTVSWVVGAIVLLVVRWSDVKTMPLNSLGDFAAGVFAPLAFLWLVLGYRQQGKELKVSTDALKQQALELQASVEQQRALAYAAREQLERQDQLLAFERARRVESSLPALHVVAGLFDDSAPYTCRLLMTNTGAVATSVTADLADASDIVTQERLFSVPIVMPGAEYSVTFDAKHALNPSGVRLRLNFRDAHNQARRATFGVSSKTSGSWDVVKLWEVAFPREAA